MLPDKSPVGCEEYDNGELTTGEILLIAQVLIGGDDGCKTGGFRRAEQFAILKRAPALLEGRDDLVTVERAPQRDGCALDKEDEPSGGYASARLR